MVPPMSGGTILWDGAGGKRNEDAAGSAAELEDYMGSRNGRRGHVVLIDLGKESFGIQHTARSRLWYGPDSTRLPACTGECAVVEGHPPRTARRFHGRLR